MKIFLTILFILFFTASIDTIDTVQDRNKVVFLSSSNMEQFLAKVDFWQPEDSSQESEPTLEGNQEALEEQDGTEALQVEVQETSKEETKTEVLAQDNAQEFDLLESEKLNTAAQSVDFLPENIAIVDISLSVDISAYTLSFTLKNKGDSLQEGRILFALNYVDATSLPFKLEDSSYSFKSQVTKKYTLSLTDEMKEYNLVSEPCEVSMLLTNEENIDLGQKLFPIPISQ